MEECQSLTQGSNNSTLGDSRSLRNGLIMMINGENEAYWPSRSSRV